MSFQDNDTGAGFGVEGTSGKGIGVVGRSSSGPGVLGETQIKVEDNPAISSLPVGVMGVAKSGVGIIGITEDGSGASGGSVKGAGVFGNSWQAEGVRAISGQSHGVSGRAINGAASGVLGTHAVDGNGVSGVSQGGNGVYGQSDTNNRGITQARGFSDMRIPRDMVFMATVPKDLPGVWESVTSDLAFLANRPQLLASREQEKLESLETGIAGFKGMAPRGWKETELVLE